MRAVVSTTFDDKYLFFLPLIRWCWAKLEIEVICFIPHPETEIEFKKYDLIQHIHNYTFIAPEHKKATYAQNLRNYGAAIKGLNEEELLCTADIDIICFKKPPYNDKITIWGYDLVPKGQFPMCFINGTVKQWKEAFNIGNKTYQECIDEKFSNDECQDFRSNRWATDQENAFLNISKVNHSLVPRAREGTQWAKNRLDRDDSYILDRLNLDNEDYHLNRPGYEEKNFSIIMQVLQFHYPNEDFTWFINFKNEYLKLL